jgi:hypothetical protein
MPLVSPEMLPAFTMVAASLPVRIAIIPLIAPPLWLVTLPDG